MTRPMSRLPEDVRRDLDWVADGVAVVPAPRKGPGAQSLLIDDGDVVLVDAGADPAWRKRLAPHVDVCILTHVHAAHVTGASEFDTVWAPREEARALESVSDYCDVHGVARRDRDTLTDALTRAGFTPVTPAKTYRAGGVLQLATHEWHLVAAPGHSPGCTLLLDPDRHILFSADYDGAHGGPWYGYASSDLDDLEETAQRLAQTPVALLVTSHTRAARRGVRPLLRGIADEVRDRDRRVLDLLRRPLALEDIVRQGPLTGEPPASPVAACAHRVMVEKHVFRLMEKGFVAARQDGRYERVSGASP